MKVRDEEKLIPTLCKRILAGITSDQLTYDDLAPRGDSLSPKMVRALQQR